MKNVDMNPTIRPPLTGLPEDAFSTSPQDELKALKERIAPLLKAYKEAYEWIFLLRKVAEAGEVLYAEASGLGLPNPEGPWAKAIKAAREGGALTVGTSPVEEQC